jgi:Glycosyl hydrolases family 43/Ricin-type beta-trefoil lectin domain-like
MWTWNRDAVTRRTRRRAVVLVAAVLGLAVALVPAVPAAAATVTFTPGAAWTDQNGNVLQMHGLGIVKVGASWYGFGEDKTGESSGNTSFQDIPCYTSTDLRNWTRQGVALARQASGDLGPNRIVERPKVIYNASTGMYVMYLHIDNSSYTDRRVGVAVSSTPCGPYTYRGGFSPLGNQGRDLGLFQDSDGSAYLMNDDPNAGLRIYRLSADYLSVSSSVALFQELEAPAIVKVGGRYFLLASHLTGWGTNDNVYASATSLSGPWSGFSDFAQPGTNTYNSQTANIITVQGSAATTYIYAGDRWTTSNLGTSPLIWLPLTISGTTASVNWYNSWSLDVSAGTWTAASSPGPVDGSTHYLTSASSGLVMDVTGASTANGAKVVQWSNHGGTNQQWTVHNVSGSIYTLVNLNSGKCLETPNQSTTQGTQLDQGTCNGSTSQQWSVKAAGTGYALANVLSGLYADVYGASTTAGAAIDQWPTTGGANQTWTFS